MKKQDSRLLRAARSLTTYGRAPERQTRVLQERLTPASDLNLSTPTDNRGYQSISSRILFLFYGLCRPASRPAVATPSPLRISNARIYLYR